MLSMTSDNVCSFIVELVTFVWRYQNRTRKQFDRYGEIENDRQKY